MKKQEYQEPKMKVVELQVQHLLAASGEETPGSGTGF